MEKPPRYTDVQFCNRAILGGWNEEKIEFTPGSQTRSHLRESRLPALVHNILIPVSLLAVVGFNWAALCAKQTQYLIHFVPMQGPLFFSHHPFSKRVRHFGTVFLPLCIKRPLNFYVMQHIFGQKRHFML